VAFDNANILKKLEAMVGYFYQQADFLEKMFIS